MNASDAQKQTQQMVNFIINEATEKAQEIEAKALEDFNIEKLKIVQQMKEKIRQEFEKKAKQIEVKRAIERSTAVNRARLKKIAARNQIVDEIAKQTNKQLAQVADNKEKYKTLMTDLIVQALLRLLEDSAIVRCREADKSLVESILPAAAKKYSDIMKEKAQVDKSVKLSIDTTFLAPPPKGNDSGRTCSGGVTVFSTNMKIFCDNTIDARLHMVAEDCKPQIRATLFPSA